MMLSTSSSFQNFGKNRSRGQVMVLGAFTILLIAMCLFMTIGVSYQARNRIQLQQTADARAFSSATATARIYNTFAYTNRAMVGNVVAMTVLHAFHSEVGAAGDIFEAITPIYSEAATMEEAKSIKCFGPFCIVCFKFQHCIHMGKLLIEEVQVLLKWIGGDAGDDIQKTESKFRSAMKKIDVCNQTLATLQTGLRTFLMADMVTLNDKTSSEINMNAADTHLTSTQLTTQKNMESGYGDSAGDDKKKEMTEMINASRPVWVRNRSSLGGLTIVPMNFDAGIATRYLKNKTDYWKVGNITQDPILGMGGGTAVYESESGPSDVAPGLITGIAGGNSKSGIVGKSVGSYDHWTSIQGIVNAGCNMPGASLVTPMLGVIGPSRLVSNANDGEHNGWGFMSNLFGDIHDGNSHKVDFKSIYKFTMYSSKAGDDDEYMQPTMVASAITKHTLSQNPEKSAEARLPWDLKFNIALDTRGAQSVDLKNNENAKAIAKAMTYYHHPGNWVEPPNFWAPFWKAKLHPFSSIKNAYNDVDLAAVQAPEALALIIQ